MKCRYSILLAGMGFAAFLLGPSPASAQVDLGSAGSFAVLAGGPVTCTNSTVTGDVGGIPITQTGCTINGTVHLGDADAEAAYADFLDAYAALAKDEPCTQVATPITASQTFSPGVYCFDSFVALTDVTFTLTGPPKGIWIFKVGTGASGGYLEANNFSVVMAGGGQPCNVYWWVERYATLTTSNFQGTILAGADITVTGGTSNGDAMAGGSGTTGVPTGAVTLTTATDVAGCEASGGRLPPGCRVKVICHDYHDKNCKHHDKNGDSCDKDCDGRHDKDCDRCDKHGGKDKDDGKKGHNGNGR